jgi:hypothetical protein
MFRFKTTTLSGISFYIIGSITPTAVKILIPSINIKCDENPDLNDNQKIKSDIINIVKKKFNQFELNLIVRPTKFFLKSNGKWIIP